MKRGAERGWDRTVVIGHRGDAGGRDAESPRSDDVGRRHAVSEANETSAERKQAEPERVET